MDMDPIVAVALLTQNDVQVLGPTFHRLWPVENIPNFDELLAAIDEADRSLRDKAPDQLMNEVGNL